MIYYPNAKINIGLRVLDKRPDNYHNILSVIYPIALNDILEIQESSSMEMSYSGHYIDPKIEYIGLMLDWLRKKDWLRSFKIHLHKNIPAGSGLGGGSSDLACFVKHLFKYIDEDSKREEILAKMTSISSDSEFFLSNKSSVVSGRGDVVEKINLKLTGLKLLLFNPNISINTAEAYRNIESNINSSFDIRFIDKSVESWKDFISNDFEGYYNEKFQSYREVKASLYRQGALFVSLSGTGSCFYGLFRKERNIPSLPDGLSMKWITLD